VGGWKEEIRLPTPNHSVLLHPHLGRVKFLAAWKVLKNIVFGEKTKKKIMDEYVALDKWHWAVIFLLERKRGSARTRNSRKWCRQTPPHQKKYETAVASEKNLFCRLGLRFNLRPQKVTQEDKNQQKRDEWHVAGMGGEHLWWDPKEPPKGLATSGFSFSWELYLEKYRMMQAKAGWWETPYFKKK